MIHDPDSGYSTSDSVFLDFSSFKQPGKTFDVWIETQSGNWGSLSPNQFDFRIYCHYNPAKQYVLPYNGDKVRITYPTDGRLAELAWNINEVDLMGYTAGDEPVFTIRWKEVTSK